MAGDPRSPVRATSASRRHAFYRRLSATASASTNPRIQPMDITPSECLGGHRSLKTSTNDIYGTPAEEAGNILAWRHAEVLHSRLKAREDFRQFAETAVCTTDSAGARAAVLRPFELGDHNLAVLSDTGQVIPGGSANGNQYVLSDYHTGERRGKKMSLAYRQLVSCLAVLFCAALTAGQAVATDTAPTVTDAPTVAVTAESGVTAPVSGFFAVLVEFNEPVTGFEMSDLQVTNGTAVESRAASRFNENGMTKWRVLIVPDEGLNDDVSVVVPAGVAIDSFGNSNTASEPFVITARGHTLAAPKAWLQCKRDSGPTPPDWIADPKSARVYYGIYGYSAAIIDVTAITLTNESGASVGGGGLAICSGRTCSTNSRIREGENGQLAYNILAGAAVINGAPSRPSDPMYIAGHNWSASVASVTATEGPDATLDFTVSLNAQDDCREVTVNYATADGTATAGEDYTAVSGTLTFAPSETSKTVSVPIIDDSVSDGSETLTFTISNADVTPFGRWPTDIATANAEATGTILNDDLVTVTLECPTSGAINPNGLHNLAATVRFSEAMADVFPGISFTQDGVDVVASGDGDNYILRAPSHTFARRVRNLGKNQRWSNGPCGCPNTGRRGDEQCGGHKC